MDDTITIPQRITEKGDLILMPRVRYEELLRLSKKYIEIDRDVEGSFGEAKQGKVVGPFGSTKELLKSLKKSQK